jgi:hypothetical protein
LFGSPPAPPHQAASVLQVSTEPPAKDAARDALNPYSPPSVEEESSALAQTSPRPGWLPILISSSLFSLAHVSNGPDWIPLFVLGLGLGYLYHKTHRVLPCLVLHMLVNALAVLQLWVFVRQEGG